MKRRPDRRRSGRHNSPKPGRWREFRRVLLWSGAFNLVLTSVFMWALLHGEAHLADKSPPTPALDQSSDPLALSRPLRSDFEMKTERSARFADHRKGPLAFTKISTMVAITAEHPEDVPATVAGEQEVSAQPAHDPGTSPVLRKSPKTGKLEIANFSTMSFEGSSEECPEFGVSMLEFADSSPDLLEVLNSTEEITVARICAANGSVILSCRNEQITLSSRRATPGDGCSRQDRLPSSIVSNGT